MAVLFYLTAIPVLLIAGTGIAYIIDLFIW
jgi:hypothetical protein